MLGDRPTADIVLVPGARKTGAAGRRPKCSIGCATVDRGQSLDDLGLHRLCWSSVPPALLKGRKATGHCMYLEPLREYGADPIGGRWVEDGQGA